MSWETCTIVTTQILGLVFFISALEYFSLPHLGQRLSSIPGWSHLFSAIILWFFPTPLLIWFPVVILILSSWLFTRRFNGGADSVMFWVSFLLAMIYSTSTTQSDFPIVVLMAIGFLGCFAYFTAGASKLLSTAWRSGKTFEWSLSQSCYKDAFPSLKKQSQFLSLGVLMWQVSFPLALTHRYLAAFFILSGLAFHLVNARVMGLNRFTFAFACFYPAIWFLAPLRL